MDPNENLREQIELAAAILEANDDDDAAILDNATRLAELVEALDGWLSKGGFLPERWTR